MSKSVSCVVTKMTMPILSVGVASSEEVLPEYSCGFEDRILRDYPFLPYEERPLLSRRNILEEQEEVKEKVKILHGVVSRLVTRGRDMDPEFVDIVDRNFWDLLL